MHPFRCAGLLLSSSRTAARRHAASGPSALAIRTSARPLPPSQSVIVLRARRPSRSIGKAFSTPREGLLILSRRKLGCAPVRCSATQSEPSPLPACRIRRLAAGRAAANHAPAAADGGKRKRGQGTERSLSALSVGRAAAWAVPSAARAVAVFMRLERLQPEGQASTQVPQSMHVSASMTYLVSPSEIAPVGHSPTQDAHITQSSEIT